MIKRIVFILVVILTLSGFTAHKFYVSVTNIVYSEKDSSFQITSRIFTDDLEAVLQERYGIESNLDTPQETKVANDYIKKYFETKFVLEINGEKVSYDFLGKEYDNDVVICYLELPDIDFSGLQSISIQNEILTDMFEEQQNIVHLKWKGKKKSFILYKENNKGMLNL